MQTLNKKEFDALVAKLKKEKSALTLILKDTYFQQILRGEKKQEYREIKPSTEQKYIKFEYTEKLDENNRPVVKNGKVVKDWYPIVDENNNTVPIEYKYIIFYVGYNTDRAAMVVEVKNAFTEVIYTEALDENGNVLQDESGETLYEPAYYLLPNGEKYYVEQITYDLGQVIAYKPKG